MAPPPIYLLPSSLRQYRTKSISSPSEHQCSLCWRDFDTKDDLSDSKEVPCRPLQILPCRHVFGSHCIDQMTQYGISNCPTCRAVLEFAPDDALDTLQRWAIFEPCKFLIDKVNARSRLDDSFQARNQRLFDGTISALEAIWLWCVYVHGCAVVIVDCVLEFGPFCVTFAIQLHILMLFVNVVTYIKTVEHVDYRGIYDDWRDLVSGIALLQWIQEVEDLVRAVLLVVILVWAGFGALVAKLIWAGVGRKR